MPGITKRLLSLFKENQGYIKRYIVPVALVVLATVFKFYAFPSFGHKLPLVLYFLVVVICGIYLGLRSAIVALIAAIIFSYSIYNIPGIYDGNTESSYSVLAAFIVAGLLVVLIAASRYRVTRISREKEEQFRFLAEAVPEKIWTADETGKANYYNQEWYEYTGFKTFEELHQQVWLLIHPDDLQLAMNAYREHVSEGRIYEIELRLKGRDGIYRWHLNRTKPQKDNQGNVTMWIGICIDIHDQKLAAEAVKESERHSSELVKKMDEFISIASHELKTPMASIQGYLQIMERMVVKNNELPYIDFISKARRQLQKLSAFVQDLLDVSKIQEGKLQFTYTSFNVNDLLQDAVEATMDNAPTHHIDIKGNTAILITADRFRLEQVLCNLLSNAIKYSPGADKVIVEVTASGGLLQVSVTDFGIGIPEEKEQYIFDRFYRVEDTSYKFSGLGIGLYICSEIIKRHKGKIWFSTIPGKGSMFSFSIPVGDPVS
ncbi:MAG TPA: ATP-binding protein [Chitinophagaceae bacterium]|nr:ATP-binding protein [Chitinophagaceae bacterium]